MKNDILFLKEKAKQIRKDVLNMLFKARSGHPGGSLSAVEIMITLYYEIMKYDPNNPRWPMRDRFILSKGHAAPTLYSILADIGIIEKDKLLSLRKLGSPLQGHPSHKAIQGIEASTGSLGHGLSIGNGIALAGRIDRRDYMVWILLGDGELQEGQVWEAAMSAGHYRLYNVCAIVDKNGFQIDGSTTEIKDIDPLADKFRAFKWDIVQVNGHNFNELAVAMEFARLNKRRPTAIIAHTIKGKGISFMENKLEFHGRAPTEEELKWALLQLK